MTLRVIRSAVDQNGLAANFAISQTRPDSWLIRGIKLIPGESIAMFGIGSALMTNSGVYSLPLMAALAFGCMVLTAIFRYLATQNVLSGKVQWNSIGIAVFTTFLWVLALELPKYLDPAFQIYPALIAFAWIIVVPLCYKGNTS